MRGMSLARPVSQRNKPRVLIPTWDGQQAFSCRAFLIASCAGRIWADRSHPTVCVIKVAAHALATWAAFLIRAKQ